MEHYVTPSTMALIRDVITFFAARPGDLAALRSLQGQLDYPDSERLPQLRAGDFRHSSDGLQ